MKDLRRKVVYFHQREAILILIYGKAPRIFKTKTNQTQTNLPNDGLTEDKTDSTQI